MCVTKLALSGLVTFLPLEASKKLSGGANQQRDGTVLHGIPRETGDNAPTEVREPLSETEHEWPGGSLFSGLQLSDLDGFELIRQLWEIPASAGSEASAGKWHGRHSEPAGDFLTQPFTRDDMEQAMAALSQCWSVDG